jgi:hypothetical protein
VKLPAKFTDELLAGGRPALTDPRVEKGDVIVIDRDDGGFPWVQITVLHRINAKTWAYLLRDDRPNLLASGARHGDGHGYTHFVGKSIRQEPEALTKSEMKKITKEAHLRDASRRNTEDAGIEAAKRLGKQLRGAAVQVARAGGDPVALVARMKRVLEDEVDTQVNERKAA